MAKRNASPAQVDTPCPHMKELAKRQAPGLTPPFNAAQQYVSNTGAHAFVAPGPNDQRGPCKRQHAQYEFVKLISSRSGPERNGEPWVSPA